METPVRKGPKKPYRTPTLKVHGDLRNCTNAVGIAGEADGGAGMGTNKTH